MEMESDGLVDKGEYYILGGDIMLYKKDPTHKQFIDKIIGSDGPTHRGLTWLKPNTWPNGVVTYRFSKTLPLSKSMKKKVRTAMDILEDTAGVKYIEEDITGTYEIWKSQDKSVGGMSTLGFSPFANVQLHEVGLGTIIHELCHGLGMFHEHQRPDRDDYIKVHNDNIIFEKQNQFWKLPGVQTYGPYDFDSIMHYPPFAFSVHDDYLSNYEKKHGWVDINDKNVLKKVSIETLDPKNQSRINQDELSKGDKKTLRKLYPGKACNYSYNVEKEVDDLTKPIYKQNYWKKPY